MQPIQPCKSACVQFLVFISCELSVYIQMSQLCKTAIESPQSITYHMHYSKMKVNAIFL